MNERIGKLLNRSGGAFYEGFLGSPNTVRFTEEELNIFVDLIVRECSKIAFQNDIAKFTRDGMKIGFEIEQHFGVEK